LGCPCGQAELTARHNITQTVASNTSGLVITPRKKAQP
jgi:hypothetical protein